MGKKILLVDDDSDILSLLGTRIRGRGHELTTAISAEEAKKYFGKRFDIAIIDSLGEDYINLYPKINAGRKVIYTGEEEIREDARERGWEAEVKDQVDIIDLIER